MKYFGEKSLSSVLSGFLRIAWYLVLVGSVFMVAMIAAAVFSPAVQDLITAEMAKNAGGTASVPCKDVRDWQEFMKAPLVARIFVFPYLAAIIVLLLQIIRRSRTLFDNFRREIIFTMDNVAIIKNLTKLLIAFSIITFNVAGLLTCVMLLMLCEIMKSGAVLQEEHDLTV